RRRGAGPRPVVIAKDALARLMAHRWPGNIRELENVIERAAILSDGKEIRAADLPPLAVHDGAPLAAGDDARPLKERVADAVHALERQAILEALRLEDGSPTRAARRLGISRASFYSKCKELTIHF